MQNPSPRIGLLSGTTTDRPSLAATIMVGSLFILGLQDSIIKLTSGDVSVWQFQMMRATLNFTLLLLLTRVVWGVRCPKPKRVWAIALRSTFLATTMILFFGGIPFLNLAVVAAGLYVFPLFVALLSSLVLREPVGPRRIVAILIGFSGTLLILKPGTEAFQPVALMPIGAAICYAANVLSIRRLCREESPITLAYGVSIAYVIFGAVGMLVIPLIASESQAENWPYLFTGWRESIPLWILFLIVICSFLNLAANTGLAKAYQSAEASWLAPFDYSYLVFATFWGFVFWHHIPDAWTFVGMAMIAASGTFVAWRERRERLRRAENADDQTT
jgi:drug/metabolite transporter (DMT)-like permease